MQGSQLIALLIGVLLLIVTIGWLVFCWYRRHVSMGVMVSQARARAIREQRSANYDVERGDQHGDHIPPPRYRSDAWQRPSTRCVPRDPKEPDYLILRRTNEEDDHYRARGFIREHLSPDRRHPGSCAENEQQQAHRQDQGHQQQPHQQQKQGKKQKQKTGNQNGQNGRNGQKTQGKGSKGSKRGNQNNHSSQNNHGNQNNRGNQNNCGNQNNRGNQRNQGGQASNPPKGKKKKKGTNTDDNGGSQQPQEDQQDNKIWGDSNSGHDPQKNNYDHQGSQIKNSASWADDEVQDNHQSNGSHHSESNHGDDGWAVPPPNSNHGSDWGSQSGSNGNGHKSGRGSRREGGSQDNSYQQNTPAQDAGW